MPTNQPEGSQHWLAWTRGGADTGREEGRRALPGPTRLCAMEGGRPGSPDPSLWPQAPETTHMGRPAPASACQGTRLPDLPGPGRHLCGLWAPQAGVGERLLWAEVVGCLWGPLLPALPAPASHQRLSCPRCLGAHPPLPPCSLFPGHTGRHCSEGRAGQQSAFCGRCLGTPLAAWGGWEERRRPGLGGGSDGWTR